MSEKLKPCPFCGGEATLREDRGDYWVTCYNVACAVNPETGMWGDALTPTNEWNDRPDVEQVVANEDI